MLSIDALLCRGRLELGSGLVLVSRQLRCNLACLLRPLEHMYTSTGLKAAAVQHVCSFFLSRPVFGAEERSEFEATWSANRFLLLSRQELCSMWCSCATEVPPPLGQKLAVA